MRAAVRTVIRYRNGVLNGKGASLLDGYMEDLATDRIYRVMIAQRMKHYLTVPKLLANSLKDAFDKPEQFKVARQIAEAMIKNGEFDPF